MNADTTAIRRDDLVHRELTSCILGCFFDVYNELGRGFLESVYTSALAIALESRGIRCRQQAAIEVFFRGVPVGFFRADVIVEERVVVEVKAARSIDAAHEAQLLNYLRASSIEVGLILNFGPQPKFRRLARSLNKVQAHP